MLKNRVEKLEGAFSENESDTPKLTTEEQIALWDPAYLYFLGKEFVARGTPEWEALENCPAYQEGKELAARWREQEKEMSPSELREWEKTKKGLLTVSEESYCDASWVFVEAWHRKIPNVPCPIKMDYSMPKGWQPKNRDEQR